MVLCAVHGMCCVGLRNHILALLKLLLKCFVKVQLSRLKAELEICNITFMETRHSL